MAWTTPVTWTTNQLVTAADLNAQVRDNENYLLARAQFFGVAASSRTTTSTSYVDMDTTNLGCTVNFVGTRALIILMAGNIEQRDAGAFDITIDGVSVSGAATVGRNYNGSGVPVTLVWVGTVAPGNRVIRARFKDLAVGTFLGVSYATFTVLEIG